MKLLRIWVCWAVAPVVMTFIHEVGHLLFAGAFGARAISIVVGPFGGGYAQYDSAQLAPTGSLFALAGGMSLNVATGVTLLLASRRISPGGFMATALSVVGALSLVFVAAYLFIGIHVGIGDPARILQLSGAERFLRTGPTFLRPLLEGIGALGVLFSTYVCAREFERHQSALWASESRKTRVFRAAILTMPLVLAFALRALVYDPSGVGQRAFKSGPRATMEIFAELEANEPTLDGPARFKRAAEILRARRALGPVDNEPQPALGVYLLGAAMAVVGGLAVAL